MSDTPPSIRLPFSVNWSERAEFAHRLTATSTPHKTLVRMVTVSAARRSTPAERPLDCSSSAWPLSSKPRDTLEPRRIFMMAARIISHDMVFQEVQVA